MITPSSIESLSLWPLLRLETLLQICRLHASVDSDGDADGGEAPEPTLSEIKLPRGGFAMGFVDKSFDQLSDVCRSLNIQLVVRGTSSHLIVELGKSDERRGAGGRTVWSASDADVALDILNARIGDVLTLTQTAEGLTRNAVDWYIDALKLTEQPPSAVPSIPIDADPALMAMMIASMPPPPPPRVLSDSQLALRESIQRLRAEVEVVADAPVAGTLSTQDGATVRIAAARTHNRHSSLLYSSAIHILRHASQVVAKALQTATESTTPVEPIPPLLLLSAMVSCDRRRQTPKLKVSHHFLDQLAWWVEQQEQRGCADPTFAQYRNARCAIEYPELWTDTVSDAEDMESADQFLQIRSYVDHACRYLA